jgi:membrane-associated phospholipid phosphatase
MSIAARLHRWTLAAFAPFNVLMLVSIPPIGGHYVIDLCGGAAVAVFSIFIVRLVRQHGSSAPEVDGNPSVSGAALG